MTTADIIPTSIPTMRDWKKKKHQRPKNVAKR